MAKITISESVGITGVSESTIRRDIKSGKVSSEKDEKGHRQIDTAELHRVYGITPPQESQVAEHDSQRVVAVLDNQISDLKAQLEKAEMRETALIDEKSKLLDLTDRLQKQNEVLMLPAEPQTKQTWWQRLTGR